MIERLVIWWIHRRYVKIGNGILSIRGTGKDYPKYLLYTESPSVYFKWDNERGMPSWKYLNTH